uniref:Uncharacterized protein n=1 Tax=Tanacetum cinerariifolium TaxID=118510 RepID=A0A6L2JWD9_TANCI|nr:hypothetical protein [Tanacetum cinerariifolium]
MYDSWKSIMELYMMNRQHGRMILEFVENSLLIWPSIEENGVTRPKKYSELSAMEAIQADCDVKATNIILHVLPPEENECKLYDKFDKFAYKKGEHYYGSPYQSQQYSHTQSSAPLSISYPPNDFQSSVHHNVYTPSSSIPQVEYAPSVNQQPKFSQPNSEAQTTQTVIIHNAVYQADDLDVYDSDCDEINTAKVALMANLSHYGSDDLAKVHNHDNVNHNLINQAMQAMSLSEQSNIVNQSKTEITSDSNIISYSQYVSESQQETVQNSNFPTQQDALILSVIEQLRTQVVNCTKINMDNKSVNDTLTTELER